ncbi:phosphohydrolase Icc [Salinisphaera shabanensis T35B1]|uniref:3'5'-cyclic adenosine monophosphate phosphodiesterase CpdA protein n=1 Tax=Salinisphaera shabanensis E1L3A TaxID=1033802 RepID=U2EPG4_9GAMM|nr:metallophosphoesterase [Salinisphaera shabanensis]ERJ19700.1 3'5'-cyclic adenosine monophosphate phosphodiesterase CpdA protein [Salinisphaera shabanensis E1L3A]
MRITLQIIHLTDLHLRADADARLHGWLVEDAFQRVLAAALEALPRPDAIVLGGDLVDDESVRGYKRLDSTLARLPCPVLAMAGNHDDPLRMAQTLEHAVVHERLRVGEWQLMALDSHINGSEAGELGGQQLERLDGWLAENTAPTLIFVHHPPIDVGAAWIDAIGLHDRDALERVVAGRAHVKAVLCGHAHQAAELDFADRPCLVTPSTMRQFAPGAHSFTDDPARAPGYRLIEIAADQSFETTVKRVRSATAACG